MDYFDFQQLMKPAVLGNLLGMVGVLFSAWSLSSSNQLTLQRLNIGASIFLALAQLAMFSWTSGLIASVLVAGAFCFQYPKATWAPKTLAVMMVGISVVAGLNRWPGLVLWVLPLAAGLSTLWGFSVLKGTPQRIALFIATSLWLANSLFIGLYAQSLACLLSYAALIWGYVKVLREEKREALA